MKNLLFIPCYRCAPQIPRVLSRIRGLLDFFHEVIVIDNLSPDETAESAQSWIQSAAVTKVRVVKNPANIGLGGSHKLAFDYAIANGFDHVVILHGDDQADPQDFLSLLTLIKNERQDCFWMGARFHPMSQLTGYSTVRIAGNYAFNILATILSTQKIFDLGGSGLNIFPTHLLKQHPYKQYANDLTFHPFLLLNSIKLSQKINFSPVSWREDDQISNVKLFGQSMKLLWLLKKFHFETGLLKDKDTSFRFCSGDWIQV